jgi:hypothetical protein
MKTNEIIIAASDDRILAALLGYGLLSASQICRLLYSSGSLSWAQAKLKRLRELDYVGVTFLPRPTRLGSAPLLYQLARKGLSHLARQGRPATARHRPSERHRSYFFLRHTMAVNDVLIGLEILSRTHPGLTVRARLTERELKRGPCYVPDGPNRRVAVVPDAWFSLLVEPAYEAAIALELDRGTEDQRQWRRKVRALVAWSKGPYQAAFGTTALTVAVVATPGVRRVTELVHWTEAELSSLGQTQEADLFRFVAADPETVPPDYLFLAPRWRRPFDETGLTLFDLSVGQIERRASERGREWNLADAAP